MGFSSDEEQRLLTQPKSNLAGDGERSASRCATAVVGAAPKDQFYIAHIIYFILGMGYLLPWNAFITAVDYFSYLYPGTPVNRVFSVAYKLSCLLPLIFIIGWAHLSSAIVRINAGLVIFTVSLVVVPVLDAFYVQTTRGVYSAYDVTVAAVILSGIGSALVQGGVIGSAGELPEIYMQAVVSGAAASGYDLTSAPFESFKQIV
ncbi:equilibrative nucleotide transporter 1-like [Phalaenopsis equestris]|uniref:equilibrative nucleotide transporter 1-like n=1 Tax=Phalaenopsis equestris TaxID=78828 RepID=UPI0009E487CE|nr:equilibrative nucleotide transporter 1-like [Phalaenopsis equestris]